MVINKPNHTIVPWGRSWLWNCWKAQMWPSKSAIPDFGDFPGVCTSLTWKLVLMLIPHASIMPLFKLAYDLDYCWPGVCSTVSLRDPRPWEASGVNSVYQWWVHRVNKKGCCPLPLNSLSVVTNLGRTFKLRVLNFPSHWIERNFGRLEDSPKRFGWTK